MYYFNSFHVEYFVEHVLMFKNVRGNLKFQMFESCGGLQQFILIDNITHQVGECDFCLKMIYLIRFRVLTLLKLHTVFFWLSHCTVQ
jgi:hypothetical protein